MISRRTLLIQTLLWVFLLGATTMASATENPKYELLQRFENIEIRHYEPMIMAVTHTKNSSGFQRLAGYIFGGNEASQKIAMTSPVANRQTDRGMQTAFMMPSQYSLEQLPTPNKDNINFVEVPAKNVAVIVFSGWANNDSVNQQHKLLQQFLTEQGYSSTGTPIINQYDDPWTPADRRTNEIHYELTASLATLKVAAGQSQAGEQLIH
jgi:hypothetical protein